MSGPTARRREVPSTRRLILTWLAMPAALLIAAAVRIAAFVAIFFLFILAFLSFSDYLTRPVDLTPLGKLPAVAAPM